VSARTDQVVLMEPEVPVTPVQGPLVAGLGVAETRDREPRPLRSKIAPPRRAAFEDRQGSTGHVHLEPNLVTDMFGNLVVSRINPTPNAGKIGLRDHSDFIRDSISDEVLHWRGRDDKPRRLDTRDGSREPTSPDLGDDKPLLTRCDVAQQMAGINLPGRLTRHVKGR